MLKPEILVERRIESEFGAKFTDRLNFSFDNVARQAKLRNAVEHHSARNIRCFKDGNLIAHQCEVMGTAESRRPRTDHRDLLIAL